MLNPEDFELPLEKQLRMRVISKEIDECNDIEALRENLKTCARLMRFQHLCSYGRTAAKRIYEWVPRYNGVEAIAKQMPNVGDVEYKYECMCTFSPMQLKVQAPACVKPRWNRWTWCGGGPGPTGESYDFDGKVYWCRYDTRYRH